MDEARTIWMLDEIAEPDKRLPDRIGHMYVTFGRKPDHKCKACTHLQRVKYHNKTYLKCDPTRRACG